jgi:two-component system, NarL family, response regulator
LGDKPVIRVLVVDDHPVFRAGLIAHLANESDMCVIGEASNGQEAVMEYRALRPDVVLIDLQMPEMGGVEATTAIRAEFHAARIVMLTAYGGDVHAQRALRAGALGYMLKDMIRKELVDTIRAANLGIKRIHPDVSARLAGHLGDEWLSERELQVLRLIAGGRSNKRIATALSISEQTVKGHVKTILGKLGANDRTHAVTLGLIRGFIEL